MLNKHTYKAKAVETQPDQRKQDSNSRYGMSVDNPANQIHTRSEIHLSSPSLFNINPNYSHHKIPTASDFKSKVEKQLNMDAGLSYQNRLHKYHYFNGKKDQPSVFCNFIKNSH